VTDTDRLDFLESFAARCFPHQEHVWVSHPPDRPDRLSQFAVPVRPLGKSYAVQFKVPHFNSLREALDAVAVEQEK
jgi:hypothetical protein